MMAIQDVFYMLQNLGLVDLILPFILIFTILFAVLEKVKIFKERKFNSVISLAMTLIVVIPHVLGQYPAGYDAIQIINSSLPGVAVWLVLAVCVLLLIGLISPRTLDILPLMNQGWISVVALAVVVFIFGSSAGYWDSNWLPDVLRNSELQAIIIVIAMFALMIWFITGPEESAEARNTRRTAEFTNMNALWNTLNPPPRNPPTHP